MSSSKVGVLVPFYRGAVVFLKTEEEVNEWLEFSSPFIEERLYLPESDGTYIFPKQFSSPFIEERLYFLLEDDEDNIFFGSRPLLSRSGCI